MVICAPTGEVRVGVFCFGTQNPAFEFYGRRAQALLQPRIMIMVTKAAAEKRDEKATAEKAEAKPATTKSANKPISVKENAEARASAYSTNRWATIKEVDETFDHDPRREVINISIMENGPPEVDAELAEEGNENAEKYSYQQVGPGVIIGMREGGEFQSADGFGWKDEDDFRAHGSPAGAGATRVRDARR